MTVGISHFLTVSAILFTLGVFGIFLNRKNVIVILMSIELILLAVNINFVAFSAALGDMVGQVFALFVLTVAAAEAAIGLAILVVFFRNRGSIAVEDVNMMKGEHGMGRFFLDTFYGAVFICVATLVIFVLLPSGKLDIENVAFAVLFGVVWGIPLGLVYALGRRIMRGASR